MSNEQIIDIKGPLIGEIEVPGDKSMTIERLCWRL